MRLKTNSWGIQLAENNILVMLSTAVQNSSI